MKLADLLAMLHNVRNDMDGPCVFWSGCTSTAGYGLILYEGKLQAVHRVVYQIFKGSIPFKFNLDHICHNQDESCMGGNDCLHRRCTNPGHLEAVSNRDNILRGKSFAATNNQKRECPKGHAYSIKNTRIQIRGTHSSRICRECDRRRHVVTGHS